MKVWVVWHAGQISRIEAVFSNQESAQSYKEHLANVWDYYCHIEEIAVQEDASYLIKNEYEQT